MLLRQSSCCAGAGSTLSAWSASNIIIKSFDKLGKESCSGSKSQRAAVMGEEMGRSSLTSFLVWSDAQIQTQTRPPSFKTELAKLSLHPRSHRIQDIETWNSESLVSHYRNNVKSNFRLGNISCLQNNLPRWLSDTFQHHTLFALNPLGRGNSQEVRKIWTIGDLNTPSSSDQLGLKRASTFETVFVDLKRLKIVYSKHHLRPPTHEDP